MSRQTEAQVAYTNSEPANTVLLAAGHLDGRLDPIQVSPGIILPPQIAKPLAVLLQTLGDDMGDEEAEEREHPDHHPSHRWQVHPFHRPDPLDAREHWTDALRLARALLGRPDPNAA